MKAPSWARMRAVLLQEYYITIRSLEVILDLYFFSAMSVTVFGLTSIYLSKSIHGSGAYYLLLGTVLWEVVRISQYSMSVSSLWNVWSHNLSNMFVTPLSLTEYLGAQMISSVFKMLLAMAIISGLAIGLFHLDLLSIGAFNLAMFTVNLSIFAWALGLALLGLIFCFGTRIQALAWGVVFIFQPLCAAFFPVSYLPQPVRAVSLALPPTHVFEAARMALGSGTVEWSEIGWMFVLNVVWSVIGLLVFLRLVRRSRRSGQFAKNDQ